MKKIIALLLITCIVLACVACDNSSGNTPEIKSELSEIFNINDSVEKLYSSFCATSEKAYNDYIKDNDVGKFVDTVYNSWDAFNDGLTKQADLTKRMEQETDKDKKSAMGLENGSLMIASMSIMNTGIAYDEYRLSGETDTAAEAELAEALVISVNKITNYFSGEAIIVVE